MDNQQKNLLGTKINVPGPATWISKPWRTFIAMILECLMNPKIVVLLNGGDGVTSISKDARIVMGPNGWVAVMDLTTFTGGISSLELTDGTHDLLAVTKITVTGAVVGGTAAAATLLISGGTGQQFKIVSSGTIDGGDYWNCKTWDGTTLGSSIIKVAKDYKLRCSNGPASDSIDGVTYSYTYATNGFGRYVRSTTGSDGTNTSDYITPPGLASDIIWAISFTTTTPATLSAVVWIEVSPHRDWASA